MNTAHIIIGGLLLILGRKLFWLFVGCLGFIAGLDIAGQYFGEQPQWLSWVIAFFVGQAGAVAALFFQNIAIILGGFLAGSTIATNLTASFGYDANLVINICGGILGAVILYSVFDYALIVLSSIVGATLIIEEIVLAPDLEITAFIVLIGAGIVFQTIFWRKKKIKDK